MKRLSNTLDYLAMFLTGACIFNSFLDGNNGAGIAWIVVGVWILRCKITEDYFN